MIVVDLSQTMISNFMASIGTHTNIKIEEDLLRHMVLNSIRAYNKKFRATYGEMVITCDAKRSWRKDVFPYYKANRKKDRDASEIDWNLVFQSLNKIREELKAFFPYRVIEVEQAEADDAIAVLVQNFSRYEKVLIISGDKDFRQLHTHANVKQYDPVRKKYLEESNPIQYVHEHTMRGDRGDGVPNFLSADDSLVTNTRQKQLRQKNLDVWLRQEPETFCDEAMLRGYQRNRQLVDLSYIPDHIRAEVMNQYQAEAGKGRDKLFNYFIQARLKNLLADIGDF